MKEADVTVIIPCFNAEKTIERAVNSVLNQTLLPKKIFLIDDCSIDNTLNIAMGLASNSSVHIEVISLTENKGPSFARNYAWNLAETEFIAFLDSDDSWMETKLKIQYDFMTENNNCILSGHKMGYFIEKNTFKIFFKKMFFYNLLLKNYFNTPSVMIRRNINLRFNVNKKFSEDYNLWLQISARYPNSIYFCDTVLGLLYKPVYGFSGLSSKLWLMQRGEIENFLELYNQKYLNFVELLLICSISYLKFIKRFFYVNFRKFYIFFKDE